MRNQVTFSLAGIDRGPAVIPAGTLPDQWLQPADRIDDGLEPVRIRVQRR